MNMTEKFRPNFLNPEVGVGPLENGEYGEGSFVKVGNLESLPDSIKEKASKGYVIKKYFPTEYRRGDFGTAGWAHLFSPESAEQYFVIKLGREVSNFEEENNSYPSKDEIKKIIFSEEEFKQFGDESRLEEFLKNTSITALAKELARRNTIMKDFFSESLPELVLSTQFIIGEEMGATEEGVDNRRIYEIQPRIEGFGASVAEMRALDPYIKSDMESLGKRGEGVLRNFILRLKQKYPDKIDLFKREIGIFIKEIKEFPNKENRLPFDCPFLTNLMFTEHGLRLVDTNMVVSFDDKNKDYKNYKIIKDLQGRFEKAIKILELVKDRL